MNFVKNWDFVWIWWKMRFQKCWILQKLRFQKCEFCEKWDFRKVNFVKIGIFNVIFWVKCEFLPLRARNDKSEMISKDFKNTVTCSRCNWVSWPSEPCSGTSVARFGCLWAASPRCNSGSHNRGKCRLLAVAFPWSGPSASWACLVALWPAVCFHSRTWPAWLFLVQFQTRPEQRQRLILWCT